MGILRRILLYRLSNIDVLLLALLFILLYIHIAPFWAPNITSLRAKEALIRDLNTKDSESKKRVNTKHGLLQKLVTEEIFVPQKKPILKPPKIIPTLSKNAAEFKRFPKASPISSKDHEAHIDPAAVRFVMPEKIFVKDVRREDCESIQAPKYEFYGNVSIIIDVSVDNVQYLAISVISALHTTKRTVVKEILVILDGSVPEILYKKSVSLFSGVKHVKFIQCKETGQIAARMKATQMVSEKVFAFIESGVWLSEGWLEPLLDVIYSHPKSIVMPLFDNSILDLEHPQYIDINYDRVHVINWDLETLFYPVFEIHTRQATMESPVVRKDMFVIRRDHFNAFKQYDLNANHPGAGHVEMSLRQWMCYGPIRIVRCSRAAIVSVDDVHVGDLTSISYIASLWLPNSVSNISNFLGHEVSAHNTTAVIKRRQELSSLKCNKNEAWYGLAMIPGGFSDPDSIYVLHSGKLQSGTGLCIHVSNAGIPFLGKCADVSTPNFAITKNGFLKNQDTGKCLMALKNFHELTYCVEGLPALQWMYLESGFLKSVGSLRCLMQMTDAKNEELQIPVGQRCERITPVDRTFAIWKFIS